jgi:SPOR domain
MTKSKFEPAAGDSIRHPEAIKEMVRREVGPMVQAELEKICRQVAVLAEEQRRIVTVLEGLTHPEIPPGTGRLDDLSGPGETELPMPYNAPRREMPKSGGKDNEINPEATEKETGHSSPEMDGLGGSRSKAEEELSLDMAWHSLSPAPPGEAPPEKNRPAPPAPRRPSPPDLPPADLDKGPEVLSSPSGAHTGADLKTPVPDIPETADEPPVDETSGLTEKTEEIEEKETPDQGQPVIFSPADPPEHPENTRRGLARFLVPALVLVLGIFWGIDNLVDRRPGPAPTPTPTAAPHRIARPTVAAPTPSASAQGTGTETASLDPARPEDEPPALLPVSPAVPDHLPGADTDPTEPSPGDRGPAPSAPVSLSSPHRLPEASTGPADPSRPEDGSGPLSPAIPDGIAVRQPTPPEPAVAEPSQTLVADRAPAETGPEPPRPWAILLATLRDPEQVGKALSIYRNMGLAPYCSRVDLGKNGIWYRVFEGYFETARAAEKARSGLGLTQALVKNPRWTARLGRFDAATAEAIRHRLIETTAWMPHTVFGTDGVEMVHVGAFYSRTGAAEQCKALRADGFGCTVVER